MEFKPGMGIVGKLVSQMRFLFRKSTFFKILKHDKGQTVYCCCRSDHVSKHLSFPAQCSINLEFIQRQQRGQK